VVGDAVSAVWLERRERPRTVNDLIAKTMHVRRRDMKAWRDWARDEAVDQCLAPIAGPVEVSVLHLRKSRSGMPDVGAPLLIVKAVIDGLVDAHVLPGDGPDVVHSLTFERPVVVGYHGLRVVVRPVEQHATKDQPPPSTGPIPLLPIPGETA
jgi:hypothetical protein